MHFSGAETIISAGIISIPPGGMCQGVICTGEGGGGALSLWRDVARQRTNQLSISFRGYGVRWKGGAPPTYTQQDNGARVPLALEAGVMPSKISLYNNSTTHHRFFLFLSLLRTQWGGVSAAAPV